MFTPTHYSYSALFRGDTKAAFDVARTALVAQGFEILAQSDKELRARGPGMSSTRDPPLAGASELTLHVDASRIEAQATLGGVARLKAFVYLFPPGLGLVLAVSFLLAGMPNWWVGILCVAPWLFLSPWMGSMIERKSTKGVDSLVRSMVQVSRRD